MKNYFINPRVIFYFNEHGLVATDLLEKNTYALELDYFKRLYQWQSERPQEITSQDEELISANVLLSQPLERGSWQGNDLSWLCHMATRLPSSLTPYQSDESLCQEMLAFAESKDAAPERPAYSESVIGLPKPDLSLIQEEGFYQVLKNRMTSRNFTTDPITMDQLSVLLFTSFGYVHGQEWPELEQTVVNYLGGERKTSPSATGLQSCEAYIAAQFVEGLAPGLYRYNPKEHQLHLIRQGLEDDEFKHIACDQFWIREAACALFIVFDSRRVFLKHEGPRALLVGHYEAGHLSQTTLLTATAMGLKTWLTATIRDEYVSDILRLESPRCYAISVILFGHGVNDPVPAKIKKLLIESGYKS